MWLGICPTPQVGEGAGGAGVVQVKGKTGLAGLKRKSVALL